ncbi:Membrane protein of ER body-like protein [Citrus sinensis]|uniref:Membrane protein of ER body-like protein n=1 Tax=Citrus sinensis TaxID=2711 RepID=A0ACB8M3L2_CITSI|nr:Membrane protein of ER body-like protein [Citrus sinensis]
MYQISVDMEPQNQQAFPWENEEQKEEEEEVGALLGRKSRLQANKTTAPPPPPAAVIGEANGGHGLAEGEIKDNHASAAAYTSHKNSHDLGLANVQLWYRTTVASSRWIHLDGGVHEDPTACCNCGIQSGAEVTGMKYYPALESSVLEAKYKDEELHMEEANKLQIQSSCRTEIFNHQISEEKSEILEHFDNKSGVVDEDYFDQESTEIIDVEGVLKKQNTHDLYCPNCKSCITRRVILVRKKPKIPKIHHKPRPDHKPKSHSVPENAPTNQGNDTHNVGSNDGLSNADDDGNLHRQPYIFRCLSCFTVFFPTCTFNMSNGQVKYMPPSCTNWLFAIFGSYNRKPATDHQGKSGVDGNNQRTSSDNMPPGNETFEPPKHPGISSSSSSSSEVSRPVTGVAENPDQNTTDENENNIGLIIETPPDEVVSSPRAPNVGSLVDSEMKFGPKASEARRLDILKSIVYGGLAESMTSLGVVTSAAATGATTLNIFAMALANLIGGLFVVAHNLRELKNDGPEGTSTRTTSKQEDRYRELLGRRENFWVHATLVFLSYIIFGLIPPVVYGFSFRESDNRDFKIAAVGGSSLACIFLLAIGKAHNQKPPNRSYVKTVLYHVSIGFTTSGLSYVFGDLIKKLAEQLHLFDSSLEPNSMKAGWASY